MAEYVLVIHGTFSAPKNGKKEWFQLNPEDEQNFCHRLNQALATTPLQDAVWRQCPGINVEFLWSGDNTHDAREDGAEKLRDLLLAIRGSDPEARIHLIAHSHGGNVVLRAIELYFKKLQEAGKIADQSHRLGRLVFMGTPFYYKRWLRGSRLSRHVAFLGELLLEVLLRGVNVYGQIVVLAGFLSLLPWINFVGFNPFEWPVWLLVVSGVLLATNIGMGFALPSGEYSDVNMYFTTASSNQPKGTLDNNVQKAPLDALVLSAGVLDEALIGLSIEPLVFGFLSPELKKRLTPSFLRLGLPPHRSGYSGFSRHDLLRGAFQIYSAPVTAFLLRATRWWTQPRLTELILDLACAAGFGLPIEEFSNAVVTPQKELKLPGVFDAREAVDVTNLFAMTRLTPRSPATLVPLDFLWDDVKLEKKLENSLIWKRVQDKLDDIRARAGRSDNEFELELKRQCAIIEVRALEFFGMVELYHSQYYANEQIIQAIAMFLKDGTRPTSFNARACSTRPSGGSGALRDTLSSEREF